MATLGFLLLKVLRVLETPYDLYWVCLLFALEGPQYLRIALWWRHGR